ncbi:unnamed protein product [Leuciscus chuanchicus]
MHYIIHQEALCAKTVQLGDVMNTVVKTVTIIRARGLYDREFQAFLSDVDAEYGDVLYHSEVRWLSHGYVLQRFYSLRSEIDQFMKEKGRPLHELSDPLWLADLAFLVDLTHHLNTLNKNLQGKEQLVPHLYAHMKAFCVKLPLFETQLRSFNAAHFPAPSEIKSAFPKADLSAKKEKYVSVIASLVTEFNQRFQHFSVIEKQIKLFSTPFLVDAEEVEESLQLQLIEMQCEDTFELHSVQLELDSVEKQIRDLLERQDASNQDAIIPGFIHSGTDTTPRTLGDSTAKTRARTRARTSPPLPAFEISTRNRFSPLRETGRDAVIIGTSIVRHVHATSGKGKVRTHCFPGARVLDVAAQVPEILNGDERIGAVVLHAGTNDIRLRQTEVLKKDYRSLIETVRSTSPETTIIVSGPLPTYRLGHESISTDSQTPAGLGVGQRSGQELWSSSVQHGPFSYWQFWWLLSNITCSRCPLLSADALTRGSAEEDRAAHHQVSVALIGMLAEARGNRQTTQNSETQWARITFQS